MSNIFHGRRNGLLTSAATHRALEPIRWLELFMMQFIRNNDWNRSAAAAWLVNNPNPVTYVIRRSLDGFVDIMCEEGLVGETLKINWPAGYNPHEEVTNMRVLGPGDGVPKWAQLPMLGNA